MGVRLLGRGRMRRRFRRATLLELDDLGLELSPTQVGALYDLCLLEVPWRG